MARKEDGSTMNGSVDLGLQVTRSEPTPWAAKIGQAPWVGKFFPRASDLRQKIVRLNRNGRTQPNVVARDEGLESRGMARLPQRTWGGVTKEVQTPTPTPPDVRSGVLSEGANLFQLVNAQMLHGINTDAEGKLVDHEGNLLLVEQMRTALGGGEMAIELDAGLLKPQA